MEEEIFLYKKFNQPKKKILSKELLEHITNNRTILASQKFLDTAIILENFKSDFLELILLTKKPYYTKKNINSLINNLFKLYIENIVDSYYNKQCANFRFKLDLSKKQNEKNISNNNQYLNDENDIHQNSYNNDINNNDFQENSNGLLSNTNTKNNNTSSIIKNLNKSNSNESNSNESISNEYNSYESNNSKSNSKSNSKVKKTINKKDNINLITNYIKNDCNGNIINKSKLNENNSTKNNNNEIINTSEMVKKKRGRKRKVELNPKFNDDSFITMWPEIWNGKKVLIDMNNNIYTHDLKNPEFLGKKNIYNKIIA